MAKAKITTADEFNTKMEGLNGHEGSPKPGDPDYWLGDEALMNYYTNLGQPEKEGPSEIPQSILDSPL